MKTTNHSPVRTQIHAITIRAIGALATIWVLTSCSELMHASSPEGHEITPRTLGQLQQASPPEPIYYHGSNSGYHFFTQKRRYVTRYRVRRYYLKLDPADEFFLESKPPVAASAIIRRATQTNVSPSS